eukprot:g40760.t1
MIGIQTFDPTTTGPAQGPEWSTPRIGGHNFKKFKWLTDHGQHTRCDAPNPAAVTFEIASPRKDLFRNGSNGKPVGRRSPMYNVKKGPGATIAIREGKYAGHVGILLTSGHGFFTVSVEGCGEVMKRGNHIFYLDGTPVSQPKPRGLPSTKLNVNRARVSRPSRRQIESGSNTYSDESDSDFLESEDAEESDSEWASTNGKSVSAASSLEADAKPVSSLRQSIQDLERHQNMLKMQRSPTGSSNQNNVHASPSTKDADCMETDEEDEIERAALLLCMLSCDL